MADLRQAAQQALDYMKSVGQTDMYAEEWAIVGRLEAALAEPQQEPVAWGYRVPEDGRIMDCITPEEHARCEGEYTVPLYAAPQPSREVELTDEEIRDLWSWSMTAEAERTANTQQHAFARAVIAAYRAKQEKT